MTIIYSFLFCGFICLVGQLILDNTKITPGHLTSSFVCVGAILGFLNIYDKIIENVGAGATVLIINFGNSLYSASLLGYKTSGVLGLFSDIFKTSCLSLSATIIFSFIFTLFSYPKE